MKDNFWLLNGYSTTSKILVNGLHLKTQPEWNVGEKIEQTKSKLYASWDDHSYYEQDTSI